MLLVSQNARSQLRRFFCPVVLRDPAAIKIPADGRFVSMQQVGDLSLIEFGFHICVDLISFNLADMFEVDGRLGLVVQESFNAKHCQLHSVQLINASPRV